MIAARADRAGRNRAGPDEPLRADAVVVGATDPVGVVIGVVHPGHQGECDDERSDHGGPTRRLVDMVGGGDAGDHRCKSDGQGTRANAVDPLREGGHWAIQSWSCCRFRPRRFRARQTAKRPGRVPRACGPRHDQSCRARAADLVDDEDSARCGVAVDLLRDAGAQRLWFGVRPGSATTRATISSPSRSSGTPTTAH